MNVGRIGYVPPYMQREADEARLWRRRAAAAEEELLRLYRKVAALEAELQALRLSISNPSTPKPPSNSEAKN